MRLRRLRWWWRWRRLARRSRRAVRAAERAVDFAPILGRGAALDALIETERRAYIAHRARNTWSPIQRWP